MDDSYPPVYYSGSPSAISKYFKNVYDGKKQHKKPQLISGKDVSQFIRQYPKAAKPILYSTYLKSLGPNRMDETELTSHNQTFNKIVPYDNKNNIFSDEKVHIHL